MPLDGEREQAAVRLLVSLMAYVFFPAILLLALLQRWLARTDRFNYAELLVFDAYCLSHASLWTIVVGGIPINSPPGITLLMAGQPTYIAWCIRGFRGVGWPAVAQWSGGCLSPRSRAACHARGRPSNAPMRRVPR